MALQITITDAGRAEIINATNTGTAPVEITEVGLGTGQYTPNPTQTALTGELKRLNTISGQVVSPDTIHVTVKDEGNDEYDVAEFGLYTASGTLFAVYSQTSGPFIQKSAQSILLLSVDVILGTLDATNLTFGDTSFANPPASETVAGVVMLADDNDALAGEDDSKAMTSAKVLAALNSNAFQATETKRGTAEIATQQEVNTGDDDTRFVTAKKLKDWVKQATESVFGLMKVATQAQTDEGTDDATAITPKKLRWGFSILLEQNGYIVFPSWMGGVIIQWGTVTGSFNLSGPSFNLTFPNACYSCGVMSIGNVAGNAEYVHITDFTASSFRAVTYIDIAPGNMIGSVTFGWLAIGH